MKGLELRGVGVRYGRTMPVSDVNLGVAPGEVVALVGPSGCGKSTLLRAVAGLEALAAGAVLWDGTDLAQVPVHRRGFGLVFQDGQLFAHHNVGQNVAFGLKMTGMPRPARQAKAAELLELVGLSGLAERSVETLSGGQAQRVALARALAPSPRLLLLDEPLSSLDADLRLSLRDQVMGILEASATAALWVTHDPTEAAAAHRILRFESLSNPT
ncbi:MAG: ATP-binding cassette domain-containing protein [Micrococcales bacterium]|nr:ATP-binding cassette domain-containing protein [Micrococcales bacterium]